MMAYESADLITLLDYKTNYKQPTLTPKGCKTFDCDIFFSFPSSSMYSVSYDGFTSTTESWYIVYFKNLKPRKCIVIADKWWKMKSPLFDLWQESGASQHQHPSQKHTAHLQGMNAGVRDVRGADGEEDRKASEEVKVSRRRRGGGGGGNKMGGVGRKGLGLHLEKEEEETLEEESLLELHLHAELTCTQYHTRTEQAADINNSLLIFICSREMWA